MDSFLYFVVTKTETGRQIDAFSSLLFSMIYIQNCVSEVPPGSSGNKVHFHLNL